MVASSFGMRCWAVLSDGVALLTGEVPDQATYASIGNIAASTEGVRSIHNDLAIGPLTPLSTRTNDTFITSKVKARFVEANKFAASHVKVVTERGVVYLMGIVRRQEGNDAAQKLYARCGFETFGIEPFAVKVDGRFLSKVHMLRWVRPPGIATPQA